MSEKSMLYKCPKCRYDVFYRSDLKEWKCPQCGERYVFPKEQAEKVEKPAEGFDSMYKSLEKYMCSVCINNANPPNKPCDIFCDSFRLVREEILAWHTAELNRERGRIVKKLNRSGKNKTIFGVDWVELEDAIAIVQSAGKKL